MNWVFSLGFLPGSSRFSPRSVEMDQLLCLPGAVYALERLLMQQAGEAMLLRDGTA